MACNQSYDDSCSQLVESLQRYYLPAAYGTIFIIGLVGNLASIFIYVAKMRPWTSNIVIMLNLALSDLLYTLSLPVLVWYYTQPEPPPLQAPLCYLMRVPFHLHLYASILFLTCVSVLRYVAVVHPLRAGWLQETGWGVGVCVVVWGLSALEVYPMFLTITVVSADRKRWCLDFASSESDKIHLYNWLLTLLGYGLPLVVVGVCYMQVAWALIAGPYPRTPSRTRAYRLTVAIAAVFVASFAPYHALRIIRVYTRCSVDCALRRGVHAAYILFRPVAVLNTCLNLPLYTLAGGRVHRAFAGLLPSRCGPRHSPRKNLSIIIMGWEGLLLKGISVCSPADGQP
ncbi:hypothetical protein JZ751_006391 [Albula glossodonta]|uniref:G-protein coupled receptors family 1 profile domain-containing protein n=1 Tax=Albula glossodonta TaxID=121402 RepID=A0A8T2MNR3_9TELE|nr:hypothetical protein JZ751_006391 [Albula glossodonta]